MLTTPRMINDLSREDLRLMFIEKILKLKKPRSSFLRSQKSRTRMCEELEDALEWWF